MRAELAAAAVAVALAGCFSGPTLDDEPCPPAGSALTYDGFGAPFFARWCASCHAGEAFNRHGAPHAYTFDTVEQIREHAARVFERAAASNTSMPPGPDDVTEADRERLAEWLACGAP
jgi:mono/diheme cytochrome c family protein